MPRTATGLGKKKREQLISTFRNCYALIHAFLDSELRMILKLTRFSWPPPTLSGNQTGVLSWNRSQTGLIELIEALVKSKIISKPGGEPLSMKEGVHRFSQFFGTEIKQWESKLSKARQRKLGYSVLLNELKDNIHLL